MWVILHFIKKKNTQKRSIYGGWLFVLKEKKTPQGFLPKFPEEIFAEVLKRIQTLDPGWTPQVVRCLLSEKRKVTFISWGKDVSIKTKEGVV